jgi:hypothetical protein
MIVLSPLRCAALPQTDFSPLAKIFFFAKAIKTFGR